VFEISKKEEKGAIKQGTIAQFMRKRTQLVGFEFGYWKHTQYAAEFLDNALDAIETYQWKELKKPDPRFKFTLDQELSLENLSIVQDIKEEEKESSIPMDAESKQTLMEEFGLKKSEEIDETEFISENDESKDEVIEKDEVEIEQEVKNIMNDMDEIIKPVESIIDVEPIVIIRLKEFEPPAFLTAELSQKNVMGYSFEIYDNGIGMIKSDLKKYGKYLASSKSMELKQTRGSQGFGAPSAFSDAQNTTGMPIITVSKSAKHIYATVMEFFTTSKNEKKYVVAPTEIDCPFLHGTYIKLNYLNVKYVRGYVDVYIKETALMNPHITIILIDPYGEQFIYPRKVSSFPIEPKYAKPHPSSTNIGDLQDLIAKSEKLTISAFLQDSFVRVSSKTAKEILRIAERDIQDRLNFLILKNGYITITKKKTDKVYYCRFEKRVYGRSKKSRNKLIPYLVDDTIVKDKYWDIISRYTKFNKDIEKLLKEIKKISGRIEKAETKKEEREFEKQIKQIEKDRDNIEKEKIKLKNELNELFKDIGVRFSEVKDEKIISDFEDLIEEVEISKKKPMEISSEQFNSLFLAFKSIKYMAPPTDTAIPVGDTILENTLIKELGLKISENLDDFDNPVDEIAPARETVLEMKKVEILNEDPMADISSLEGMDIKPSEIQDLSVRILSTMDFNGDILQGGDVKQVIDKLVDYKTDGSADDYQKVFEFFVESFTRDDDFVAAETRDPTSGKGLAYVVEGVLAYSKNLDTPKRSRDVLSRFVNRTPKLRDSADCAITKAVQSVNWKNYKLDTYDNGLPKGPIKLLVNVSGPFVHLMFKSQSKNSLADDEELIKEIKYCLEAIGRRLRIYLNRRQAIHKSEKRGRLIEKYIPQFIKSVYNIAIQGDSKFKDRLNEKELIELMKGAIGKKGVRVKTAGEEIETRKPEEESKEKVKELKKEEKLEEKAIPSARINIEDLNTWTVKKLRAYCAEHKISIPDRVAKLKIIEAITNSIQKPEKKPVIKEIAREEIKREIKEIKEKPKVIEESATRKARPERKIISKKSLSNWTIAEIREYAKEHNITLPSRGKKSDLIDKIHEVMSKEPEVEKIKPIEPKPVAPGTIATKREQLKAAKGEIKKPSPSRPKPIAPPAPKIAQAKLPMITNEKILKALSKQDWQPITELIFKLKIRDMMDARFLQIKLRNLEQAGLVIVDIKKGKKHWRLK